jgi:hypothetical protein
MPNHESCEVYVSGLYASMLSDIVAHMPDLHTDCERDYKRLLFAIEQHGIRFALETLPTFCKHFEKCLENGRLSKSGLTHFGPYRHDVVIPRLFRGLLQRVFDRYGVLRSDPDHNCIRYVRQLCLAVKRYRVSCPETSTWKQVDEFYRTDCAMDPGSQLWDLDHPSTYVRLAGDSLSSIGAESSGRLPEGTHPTLPVDVYRTVQSVADVIMEELGGFDPNEWDARHGPGVVSDQRDRFKYRFPNWSDRLEDIFPMADFAYANYGHWVDDLQSERPSSAIASTGEPVSRLLAVPKNFAGPRLIASEPTSHQWCQQIIRDFLTSRVGQTSIGFSVNFRSQSPNQELAREASHSLSHSTIDLSSASDRISCRLVENIFRRNPSLLAAFAACRTRWIWQDIDRNSPGLYKLRKFSTMGSAVTFPVQTYLFSIISVGCLLHHWGRPPTRYWIRKASREVRVFGDDIIVPINVHTCVTDLLTLLGLKVNPNKTFWTGKFRESCGYEGYDGHDVTKVSFMSTPSSSKPESILSAVDSHSNLMEMGLLHAADFVRRTVDRFRGYIIPEVPFGSGFFGWQVYGPPNHQSLRKKWDEATQRLLYYVSQPHSRGTRTPVEDNASLLQYFTEVHSTPISREIRIGRPMMQVSLSLKRGWAPISGLEVGWRALLAG